MIRAVIFDFNGVLVDDEHLHFELLREILATRGVKIDHSEYLETFMGWDDRRCFEEGLTRAGGELSPTILDELIADKAARYERAATAGLPSFPGAIDCVRAMAARWPIAINSGALRAEIELNLAHFGVKSLFSAVVASEDTDRCKPDPEGYLLALDALRAAHGLDLEAAHCLVIEDTVAGVQAAKRAGMWVLGVTNTTDAAALRAAGAEFITPSLESITPDSVANWFAPEVSP